MARMRICKFRGQEIGIEKALEMRAKTGERAFQCLGCGHPVIAHAGGSDNESHFEHAPGATKDGTCPTR